MKKQIRTSKEKTIEIHKNRVPVFVKGKTSIAGITLIALVITIIVLLILAGISIVTLTGENGILNQAGTAKEKTKEAEIVERAKLILVNWKFEKNSGKKFRKNI